MSEDLLELAAEFVNRRLSAGAGVEHEPDGEPRTLETGEDEPPGGAAIRMMRSLVADLVALEDVEPLMATIASDAAFVLDSLPGCTLPAARGTVAVGLAKTFALGHYVGSRRPVGTPLVSVAVLERVLDGEYDLADVVREARRSR